LLVNIQHVVKIRGPCIEEKNQKSFEDEKNGNVQDKDRDHGESDKLRKLSQRRKDTGKLRRGTLEKDRNREEILLLNPHMI
jgi:hypothetical protein